MDDTTVEVRIVKGKTFVKELIIKWDGGGRTELVNHQGVLFGRDGQIFKVKRGDEHEKVCEVIIADQGYSFRKRKV